MRYIGEFNKGKMEGKGVLLLTGERKWVYGKFKNGKLVRSIRDNQSGEEGDSYGWAEELVNLHRGFKEHYINAEI